MMERTDGELFHKLMSLNIGEELEIVENHRRFIRVPGGWIFENYYKAFEKVIPIYVPEPAN